jgi:hypothetical protein
VKKLSLIIFVLSLPFLGLAQDEEVVCDEKQAQITLQRATENLAKSLENEYPNLKLDCQINKSYGATNYDVTDKEIESKQGPKFDYFKGYSVCDQRDQRIQQLVKSSFSFIIEKDKCQVLKMERVQSKTNMY